ncbi:hypothetical protein EDB80DRAFT_880430 [Ilyonectria destructans]|nr:hypothetical protein EDB80DRAFT_880430 [Ilyonectria destructans]
MGVQDNPRGHEAVRISAAITVVGNLVVISRLYTRLWITQKPGVDDLCVAVAMLFSTAFTVLVKVQADAGLGVHESELSPKQVVYPLKSFFASILCYYLAISFTKASILFQYLRLFYASRLRFVFYAIGGFIVLFSTETIILTIILCRPIEKFWTPPVPGTCIDKRPLWLTNCAIHITTDFALILLPMPALYRMNLPRRQKIALIFVFAVGGVACVTSIIRLHSVVKLTTGGDLLYDNANTVVWSAGELNISLICACLPALRAFFGRMTPSFLESSHIHAEA